MEEAFSLAGMIEAPVLFVVGQRYTPSTGGPTYTEQADLLFSLYPGQGEFPRIVASPGSIEEAFRLTGELLDLVWRFQTPGILLTEKHLTESSMSVDLDPEDVPWVSSVLEPSSSPYERYRETADGVSPLRFPPSADVIKWNSYEHKPSGLTTEDPGEFRAMQEKRRRKMQSLEAYVRDKQTVNTFGEGEWAVFSFGSTTMSVREAAEYGSLPVEIVQPIYLEPFPVWALESYRSRPVITVEQNSTGQLAQMLREKAGIQVKQSVLKYDGRPFEPTMLARQLKEACGL